MKNIVPIDLILQDYIRFLWSLVVYFSVVTRHFNLCHGSTVRFHPVFFILDDSEAANIIKRVKN